MLPVALETLTAVVQEETVSLGDDAGGFCDQCIEERDNILDEVN